MTIGTENTKNYGPEGRLRMRRKKKENLGLSGGEHISTTSQRQPKPLAQDTRHVKGSSELSESTGTSPSAGSYSKGWKKLEGVDRSTKLSRGSKGKRRVNTDATKLRDVLFDTLEKAKKGKIDPLQVNSIIRTSKEILSSVRAEIVAREDSEFFGKKDDRKDS